MSKALVGMVVAPDGTVETFTDYAAYRKRVEERWVERELEVILLNRPNWTDPDYELAQIVTETAAEITNIRPVPAVSLGNTDARLWRYQKIPSVVYGPSPKGMGSTNEHVPVEEALNVVRCHVLSAAAYLFRQNAEK